MELDPLIIDVSGSGMIFLGDIPHLRASVSGHLFRGLISAQFLYNDLINKIL